MLDLAEPRMRTAAPFASLAALRAGHRQLVERLKGEDDDAPTPDFIAAVVAFQADAAATGATIAAPDERAEVQSTINFWMTVRFNAGERAATVLLADFDHDAARARAGASAPYKGLEPFQIGDSAAFFGRFEAVRTMIDRLATNRLLAVTGLSGSGKSSVVRAGLIPQLREGAVAGSTGWRILDPIVPGTDPLAALGAAVGTPTLGDPAALVEALDAQGCPVVVSVDQFEELFTLSRLGPERDRFVDALTAAATTGAHRHIVIITMRGEYDTNVAAHEAFKRLFDDGRVVIGALPAAELRAAIELPAVRLGASFEPGLADELIQRVLGEPAGLPLLQFTLLELWKRRQDEVLRWADYTALGGNPRDILARRADEVLDGLGLASDRTLSRRIFTALVQIGAGLEATSRRIKRADLDPAGSRDALDRVLDIWRENGLIRVSPPGPIGPASDVEVAHEALIRNWDRLVDWVEEEFAASKSRRAFALRAKNWQEGKEETLGELALAEAEAFTGLEPLETEYVAASRAAVDSAAETMRRRQRLTTSGVVFAILLLLFAGVVSWIAQTRTSEASVAMQEARIASKAAAAATTKLKAEQARTRTAQTETAKVTELLAGLLAQKDAVGRETAAERQTLDGLKRASLLAQAETVKLRAEYTTLLAAKKEADEAATRQTAQLSKQVAQLAEDRPMIGLRDGRLETIPDSWPQLQRGSAAVEARARSVGLLSGAGRGGGFGTAFMIAPGIALGFLTNEEKDLGITFGDTSDTASTDTSRRFAVVEILGPSDGGKSMMRFLRLAPTNAAGERLPRPLPIALAGKNTEIAGHMSVSLRTGIPLYIVGYAPTATRAPGRSIIRKNVQPGFLLDWSAEKSGVDLRYDIQTTNGNSGAPVIDIETGRVIGTHYGSWAAEKKEGKRAVAFTSDLLAAARAAGVSLTVR